MNGHYVLPLCFVELGRPESSGSGSSGSKGDNVESITSPTQQRLFADTVKARTSNMQISESSYCCATAGQVEGKKQKIQNVCNKVGRGMYRY